MPTGLSTSGARKRVLTEDRRRQNREAQRRWRGRRKAEQTRGSAAADNDVCLSQFRDGGAAVDAELLDPSSLLQQIDTQDEFLGLWLEPPSIEPSLLMAEQPPLDSGPSNVSHHCPRTSNDHTSALPSPYKNYMQIQKLNFHAARIQNALYIGAPLILAQKTENSISPWYWHAQFAALVSTSVTPTSSSDLGTTCTLGGSDLIIRPARRHPCFELSRSVMADLAPSPLQRSHPHDMYIDMIPFPVFRDRVITLLNMDPPAFDENELKRDIEAEGLLVWGVGQGKQDQTATLVRDRRNWECATWFFKKWRLLVSGSGLEEQSRWWRMMRGDEDSGDEDT